MTKEDIVRMAREAGAEFAELPMTDAIVFCVNDRQWNSEELERFVAFIVSAEREACAKLADTISDKYGWGHYGNEVDTADEIAKAIRARGQA